MGSSSTVITNLPYQRLTDEEGFDIDVLETRRQCHRFRRVVSPKRRRRIRVRVRVRRLRRFLRRRAEKVRFGILKVLKRLKESQAYFGDLFAGNYLFMQVSPTSLKYVFENSCQGQNGNVVPKFVSTLPRSISR